MHSWAFLNGDSRSNENDSLSLAAMILQVLVSQRNPLFVIRFQPGLAQLVSVCNMGTSSTPVSAWYSLLPQGMQLAHGGRARGKLEG